MLIYHYLISDNSDVFYITSNSLSVFPADLTSTKLLYENRFVESFIMRET